MEGGGTGRDMGPDLYNSVCMYNTAFISLALAILLSNSWCRCLCMYVDMYVVTNPQEGGSKIRQELTCFIFWIVVYLANLYSRILNQIYLTNKIYLFFLYYIIIIIVN